jgi:hypothetical protein
MMEDLRRENDEKNDHIQDLIRELDEERKGNETRTERGETDVEEKVGENDSVSPAKIRNIQRTIANKP